MEHIAQFNYADWCLEAFISVKYDDFLFIVTENMTFKIWILHKTKKNYFKNRNMSLMEVCLIPA